MRLPSPRERGAADEGMTLVELIVAMIVFSLCMAVFIAGVLQMTRTTVRAQVVTASSDQLRAAFEEMDARLRSAEAVNAPGVVGQSWFLEFRTPGFDGAGSTCTQWRYSVADGTLEGRRWDVTQTPADDWTVLASGLSKASAVLTNAGQRPFTMTPAAADREHQSVAVLLQSPRTGTTKVAPGSTGEQVRATFTALNSDINSDGNALLADGTSRNPVCSATTTRTE